jgi:hypothetical protein
MLPAHLLAESNQNDGPLAGSPPVYVYRYGVKMFKRKSEREPLDQSPCTSVCGDAPFMDTFE